MSKGKNGASLGEDGTLIGNGARPTNPNSSFATFLFNKQDGTCCGRNAKSWLGITVFYIVFYTCLAAFWVACLAIFLNTIDPKVPKYYGKGSIRGIYPGVGYQPWLKETPDSTLIKYNVRDPRTWKAYTEQLNSYLAKYQDLNETRDCKGEESNWDASGDEPVPACQFSLKVFDDAGCSAASHYGFKAGKPCVAISLNRLIGWEPLDFSHASIPEVVRDRYKNGSIAIHCDGTNLVDKEHIGKITYLPEQGIDGKYYPYTVMPNYHQPIAMVRFDALPRNKLVFVECRAYADNIVHDISQKLGLVHFEMFVQDKAVKGLKTFAAE